MEEIRFLNIVSDREKVLLLQLVMKSSKHLFVLMHFRRKEQFIQGGLKVNICVK